MHKLTDAEIADRLTTLDGWSVNGQSIEKVFEFADFRTAIAFMNRLVPMAETLNHHPDWSNAYNKVRISLTSHDAGGLTDADFAFASAADEAATQTV